MWKIDLERDCIPRIFDIVREVPIRGCFAHNKVEFAGFILVDLSNPLCSGCKICPVFKSLENYYSAEYFYVFDYDKHFTDEPNLSHGDILITQQNFQRLSLNNYELLQMLIFQSLDEEGEQDEED